MFVEKKRQTKILLLLNFDRFIQTSKFCTIRMITSIVHYSLDVHDESSQD